MHRWAAVQGGLQYATSPDVTGAGAGAVAHDALASATAKATVAASDTAASATGKATERSLLSIWNSPLD